jgi:hypothetical protein
MSLSNVKFLIPDLLHSKYTLQTTYSSVPQLSLFSRRSPFFRKWSKLFSILQYKHCSFIIQTLQNTVPWFQQLSLMLQILQYYGTNFSIPWSQHIIVRILQYYGTNYSVLLCKLFNASQKQFIITSQTVQCHHTHCLSRPKLFHTPVICQSPTSLFSFGTSYCTCLLVQNKLQYVNAKLLSVMFRTGASVPHTLHRGD